MMKFFLRAQRSLTSLGRMDMTGQPWSVHGVSVQGSSHKRNGLPNQDAIGFEPRSGLGQTAVVALADGHGSRKSFRSDTGARLAVQVALDQLRVEGLGRLEDPNQLKHLAEEQLPQDIVRNWQAEVRSHMSQNPITEHERAELFRATGEKGIEAIRANEFLPYGSTLLAVLATSRFLLYLRLGDGDILAVSAAGEVTMPVPDKEVALGDDTVSLCSNDSWRHFNVRIQSEFTPALVLLATDGYSKSFADQSGFLKVGSDIYKSIRSDGADSLKANLPEWLTATSQQGSGDDITVGLLHRADS